MKYLLVKHDGLFWCPGSSGYTQTILQAGVYDEAKAAQYQPGKSEHSLAVPFDASIVRRIEAEVARVDPEIANLIAAQPLAQLNHARGRFEQVAVQLAETRAELEGTAKHAAKMTEERDGLAAALELLLATEILYCRIDPEPGCGRCETCERIAAAYAALSKSGAPRTALAKAATHG